MNKFKKRRSDSSVTDVESLSPELTSKDTPSYSLYPFASNTSPNTSVVNPTSSNPSAAASDLLLPSNQYMNECKSFEDKSRGIAFYYGHMLSPTSAACTNMLLQQQMRPPPPASPNSAPDVLKVLPGAM